MDPRGMNPQGSVILPGSEQQALFWLLTKHRVNGLLRGKARTTQLPPDIIPHVSIFVDHCKQQHALCSSVEARPNWVSATGEWSNLKKPGLDRVPEELASIPLDLQCPDDVAYSLLDAFAKLANSDPATILGVYASRLSFYCEAQNDSDMRDQVQEVGGMIRALEYFTRTLFRSGEDDICIQFLYSDLSLPQKIGSNNDHGAGIVFRRHLTEEALNRLLCGRKEYPHAAQLINGCVISRISLFRRYAYETLANVAIFAKEHKEDQALNILLRQRHQKLERDPRLVGVLAALVWELIFVNPELQEQLLPPRDDKGVVPPVIDDLFDDSTQVRLVALHSLGRLLLHQWIPGGATNEDGGGASREDSSDQASGLFPPQTRSGGLDAEGAVAAGPPEHTLLRLIFILHTRIKGRSTEARQPHASAQTIVELLRSRRARAQGLLARTAALAVEHGLANGVLEGLYWRFSSREAPCFSPRDCDMSPAEYLEQEGGQGDWGGSRRRGRGISDGQGFGHTREGVDGNNHSALGGGGRAVNDTEESDNRACLGVDARKYARIVHYLVEMLSDENRAEVRHVLQSYIIREWSTFTGGTSSWWDHSEEVNAEKAVDWVLSGGEEEERQGGNLPCR